MNGVRSLLIKMTHCRVERYLAYPLCTLMIHLPHLDLHRALETIMTKWIFLSQSQSKNVTLGASKSLSLKYIASMDNMDRLIL